MTPEKECILGFCCPFSNRVLDMVFVIMLPFKGLCIFVVANRANHFLVPTL